jgi:hypothetical protein
MYLDRLL